MKTSSPVYLASPHVAHVKAVYRHEEVPRQQAVQ